MRTISIGSAVICLCGLLASSAIAWTPPGDRPGSGEITTPDEPTAAGLSADLMTYAPGTIATLTGVGFLGGEGITVQVVHHDGTPAFGAEHEPWRLAAGQDGAFTTAWRVCTDDCVGKVVRAVAVGEISGRQADVHFTDGTVTPAEPPAPPPRPGDKPGAGEITTDDPPSTATALRADQTAYVPGATATLLGAGFLAGEAVMLQVLHQDGSAAEGTDHWPWRVAADPAGAFSTAWRVCTDDCVGKFVRAVAVGELSGRNAEVRFADGTVTPAEPPAPPPRPGDKPGSGEITTDDSPGATTGLRADQVSYVPGTEARLAGVGFLASETVSLQVLHLDGSPAEGTDHWPWKIAADQTGAFTTGWRVCTDDCVGKMLRVVAVGEFSGLNAEVHFGDGTTVPAQAPALPATGIRAGELALRPSSPNPFRASTAIHFTLPERSAVSVRVFDLFGQEVATLASGTMDAGAHSVVWNGHGRDGRRLAAGVYFCRMDAGAFHQLRKITLMR